jgi:5-methyltetrahydropteroyltriglutamate--homocysteine methyltransferase
MITVHADVVGSLLRPAELLAARKHFADGNLTSSQFTEIENSAADAAIALQENVGLEIVTDGEMRRQSFQSQMTAAVSGFGVFDLDAFLWGDWRDRNGVHSKRRPPGLGVVEKLQRLRYFSADEFSYLKANTNRIPKITIPSPSLWANFWSPRYSRKAYPTLDVFLGDIVDILREEVADLSAAVRPISKSTRPITACCSIRKREFSTNDSVGILTGGSRWALSSTMRLRTGFPT